MHATALHAGGARHHVAAARQPGGAVRCRKLAQRCQVARPRGSKGDEVQASPPETLAQSLPDAAAAEGAPWGALCRDDNKCSRLQLHCVLWEAAVAG